MTELAGHGRLDLGAGDSPEDAAARWGAEDAGRDRETRLESGVGAAVLAAALAGEPAPALTTAQVDLLLAPLAVDRVRQHEGNDHLEAWDVRRWLLRVFGWGGWDLEVLETVLIYERHAWPAPEGNLPLSVKGGRHSAAYRVTSRLTIKDARGRVVARFDDAAVGGSSNQVQPDKAHDQALKTAHSQALKRVAVNLGDAFGLSLYANLREPAAVVGRSVAHPGTFVGSAAEAVSAGELDEARTGEDDRGAPATASRQREAQPGLTAATRPDEAQSGTQGTLDGPSPVVGDGTPEERAGDVLARLSTLESEAEVHALRRDAALAGDLLELEVLVSTGAGQSVRVKLSEAFDRRLARLVARRSRAGGRT